MNEQWLNQLYGHIECLGLTRKDVQSVVGVWMLTDLEPSFAVGRNSLICTWCFNGYLVSLHLSKRQRWIEFFKEEDVGRVRQGVMSWNDDEISQHIQCLLLYRGGMPQAHHDLQQHPEILRAATESNLTMREVCCLTDIHHHMGVLPEMTPYGDALRAVYRADSAKIIVGIMLDEIKLKIDYIHLRNGKIVLIDKGEVRTYKHRNWRLVAQEIALILRHVDHVQEKEKASTLARQINELAKRHHAMMEDKGFHETPDEVYQHLGVQFMSSMRAQSQRLEDVRAGLDIEKLGRSYAEVSQCERRRIALLKIALIATELNELAEEAIKQEVDTNACAEECADVILRLLDFAQANQWDVGVALEQKIQKNATRQHKHGKLF